MLCQWWPVSLSPTGVYSDVWTAAGLEWRPIQPSCHMRLDEIHRVDTDEKRIRINGQFFARVSSARLAEHVADLIWKLKKLPEGDRAGAIQESIKQSMDSTAVEGRVAEYDHLHKKLQPFTNCLFLYLFVLTPITAWWYGWIHCWWQLLVGLMIGVGLTAIVFSRSYRALYPNDVYHRRLHTVVLLLNPLSAIRAHDLLARDLLAEYHPLAVGRVLCDSESFRDLARPALLDLRHPLVIQGENGESDATASWYHQCYTATTESWFKSISVDLADLLFPPLPMDEACQSFCPRCQCQYVVPEGICQACGGIPLRAFDNDKSSP
jgi:hypothetical protein